MTARTSSTASTAAAEWTSPASRCWCARNSTENFAVEANYFIDKVSGASIDVLSNASTIKDERKQKSGTVEYLHDKTTYSQSYINSTRNATTYPTRRIFR